MSIPATQGIAGYAFTGGEPIAIADPERDPRFTKDFSAGTGYVPRTILAMPMRSGNQTTGILEVLDKHQGSFSMRDIELASVFADQAAVAIQIGALALDSQKLIRTLLAGDIPPDDDAALQELISAATRAQSGDDRFWEFVDAIVKMRLQRPEDRELAVEILDVVVRHAAHAPRLGSTGRLRR
jgi:GAF domain-containing protein